MYGAGIEIGPKEITDGYIYIGFVVDISGAAPSWIILAGSDEKELKQEMIDDGAESTQSFVVKVKVPDIAKLEKKLESIKTLELSHEVTKVTVQ